MKVILILIVLFTVANADDVILLDDAIEIEKQQPDNEKKSVNTKPNENKTVKQSDTEYSENTTVKQIEKGDQSHNEQLNADGKTNEAQKTVIKNNDNITRNNDEIITNKEVQNNEHIKDNKSIANSTDTNKNQLDTNTQLSPDTINKSVTNTEKADQPNESINDTNTSDTSVLKVNAITEISFGNTNKQGQEDIVIYISPSCLHCGKFLDEEFTPFLKKNKNDFFIQIKFLPSSAKDLFIMKLIQAEARDQNGYYIIFTNFIKRVIATIDNTVPTKEQQEMYLGSETDQQMLKYQVIASEFGFEDRKIQNAYPNMESIFEQAIINWYKSELQKIKSSVKTKAIDLPLIIYKNQTYINLSTISNNQYA